MESWNQMSTDKVRTHTPGDLNRRIDAKVEACVQHMAEQERPVISAYLEKLEREWDLGRALSVGASAATLVGLAFLRRGSRTSAWWSGLSAALLLQHGLFGFGPLASLVRAVGGVRTRKEIDLEKFALKALRGDFSRIPHEGGPRVRANAALVAAQS